MLQGTFHRSLPKTHARTHRQVPQCGTKRIQSGSVRRTSSCLGQDGLLRTAAGKAKHRMQPKARAAINTTLHAAAGRDKHGRRVLRCCFSRCCLCPNERAQQRAAGGAMRDLTPCAFKTGLSCGGRAQRAPPATHAWHGDQPQTDLISEPLSSYTDGAGTRGFTIVLPPSDQTTATTLRTQESITPARRRMLGCWVLVAACIPVPMRCRNWTQQCSATPHDHGKGMRCAWITLTRCLAAAAGVRVQCTCSACTRGTQHV